MSDPSVRYTVIRSLGQGGMGEVFLAEDARLERQVAVKFLPAALRDDARARERFEREAKSAAALDHPYICKIFEVATLNGQACIVMEYVEGETLAARLRRGRLEIKEALPLALEVAEALEEAHRRRILHRDLKPVNIMLTAQGHVKVMDFGLARRLPDAGVEASQATTMAPRLTGWGMQVGTPAYMSPEQALGTELDERSDLFAFGIVLYELLAGTHPFDRGSPSATLAAIVREAVPPLRRSVPDAPEAVDVLVSKLLAKEPADRYQSFRDVAGDLRRLREQLAGRAAAAADRTVRYLRLAGDQAFAASAFEEAVRVFDAALLLEETTEGPERADLLDKRGRAKRCLGQPEKALDDWYEALAIYDAAGSLEKLAPVCNNVASMLFSRDARMRRLPSRNAVCCG